MHTGSLHQPPAQNVSGGAAVPVAEQTAGAPAAKKFKQTVLDLRMVALAIEDVPELSSTYSEAYRTAGILSLLPWQRACLNEARTGLGVENVLALRRNFIITAPTSGGKSLVAEIIMLHALLQHRKAVVYVVPYRCLVDERTEWLRRVWPEDVNIVALRGGKKSSIHQHRALNRGRGGRPCCVVATIESAKLLVNKLLKEKRTRELGVVVVDEVHMVGDASRGPILETLVTMLRSIDVPIPIIAMSATLSHACIANAFAPWLDGAGTYESTERPVPLRAYVVHNCCTQISDGAGRAHRVLSHGAETSVADPGATLANRALSAVRQLVEEVAPPFVGALCAAAEPQDVSALLKAHEARKKCVLVFCAKKKECSNVVNHISTAWLTRGDCASDAVRRSRRALLDRMKCAAPVDEVMTQGIMCGVVYHHADVPHEQRAVIERAYRRDDAVLPVIVCTSTLATGVNLPAARVIVRNCCNGIRELISAAAFRQMAGRAGRTGQADAGDAFLIVDVIERKHEAKYAGVKDIIANNGATYGVSSALRDVWVIGNAAVDAIAVGIADTKQTLEDFFKRTLAHAEPDPAAGPNWESALTLLEEKHFLEIGAARRCATGPAARSTASSADVKGCTSALRLTPLGNATFYSGIHLRDAERVYCDLSRARHRLVATCWLHFIFLFTPLRPQVTPTLELAHRLNRLFSNPQAGEGAGYALKEAASAFGVSQELCMKWDMRLPKHNSPEAATFSRVVVALIVNARYVERKKSEAKVAAEYAVSVGKLRNICDEVRAHSFRVVTFAHHLNWPGLEAALGAAAEQLFPRQKKAKAKAKATTRTSRW